jgi:hypothetical protein
MEYLPTDRFWRYLSAKANPCEYSPLAKAGGHFSTTVKSLPYLILAQKRCENGPDGIYKN